MYLSVIKMESACTQSVCYVLILLTTGMRGVQLQDKYWNFGFWVPDSKTVFPPTLLFHRYRNTQRDYNQFIKPSTPHHAWVNFGFKETGTIRDSQNRDRWVKRSEKEVINHSDSITGKSNVLLHEREGNSENNEHDTRRDNFNNITWPSVFGKGSVGYYKNDSVLGTLERKLIEPNRVRSLNYIGSRRVDNYTSDLGASQHQVNDTNFSVAHTSLDKHNGHSSHDRHHSVKTRNIMWSTELGSVTAEHQLSALSPSIMRQEDDSPSMAGHKKSASTANRQAKEHIYLHKNTGRQQTEDKRHDILQSFHIFERSRFNDFGTSKEKKSNNVWDESDLGINRFSDSTWHNDFGTERQQDNTAQNRFDSARRLHRIIARRRDASGRSNYGKGGAQGRYDSAGNLFDYNIRHRDSGSDSVKDVGKYKNSFDSRFIEDKWHSHAGTGSDVLQISGKNQDDSDLQHSFNSARSQFGDVRWPSDTDTITEGGKQDSVNMKTTSDSEGQGNYRRGTEKHDPGQDKFDFHRNRFGGITWDNGYSSGSGYHLPEFSQLHEFDSNKNRFRGTSWHSEYSFHGEKQHVPPHEQADGERIKNQHTDGTVSFHHRGHPQIATDPPDDVTSYILPNGTRVVRLKRIVLYRKPETPPQEDSPRTFADIAKGIIQKKVAKFLSLFTIVQFPNEPCQTSEGVNGTCYHHLQCRSLGGISSGSCAQGYGICCYFEKSCGEVTRQNCSYFVNPGFPAPVTNMLACILTVEKAHPDVSQIRLDFFMFELLGPTNGTCIEDQFIVVGQNTNNIAPIICGINTGQHIYMDVDSITGPLRLNMLTMRGDIPRSFRIKVTQIKKGSPLEAPKNCLQYHTGIHGSIESFNYQMPKRSNLPARPGYMNNLNYAICINKEPGYCSVTYSNTAPDGRTYPLQLNNVDQDGQPLIPPGQAGAEVFNCPDDYIVINGIRLCGERLNDASVQLDFTRNSPVTDISNGPFTIPVRTNANTNGRGFRIDYWQNSCAS